MNVCISIVHNIIHNITILGKIFPNYAPTIPAIFLAFLGQPYPNHAPTMPSATMPQLAPSVAPTVPQLCFGRLAIHSDLRASD